jgi:hypothetical protein
VIANRGVADALDETESPYTCFVSRRTPDGPNRYSYSRMPINVPQNAVAADGQTIVVRYVWRNPGEEPSAAANCCVPRTPEAVKFMDRRLGVEGRRRFHRMGQRSADGTASTMASPGDCWYDSYDRLVCPIDGIIVTPWNPVGQPYDPYDNTPCWINCAGGASQGNPGGGDGYDPGTPEQSGPCNTGDSVYDNPAVNAGFTALWSASNYGPNIIARREAYGWVVMTASGYRIHMIGTTSYCGGNDLEMPWPPEGPDAVVAFVHTHPYEIGDLVPICGPDGQPQLNNWGVYPGGASDVDRATSIALGDALGRGMPLPGLVLDVNGMHQFIGDDHLFNSMTARCGY